MYTRAIITSSLLLLTAANDRAPRADYRRAAADEDVSIAFSADRTITTSVKGGRSVSIDGRGRRVGRIALYGVSSRVIVRNIHIVPSGDDDGLDVGGGAGGTPTVTIENVRITGVGTKTNRHPDCIQPQEDIGVLLISGVTCETGYQGLYVKGNATHRVTSIVIRNSNFRHAPGTDPNTAGPLLWFIDNGFPRVPVYLENVWVASVPGRRSDALVWPRRTYKTPEGEDISPIIDESAGTIRWPPAAKIFGVVRIGTPPGGDFAQPGNNHAR